MVVRPTLSCKQDLYDCRLFFEGSQSPVNHDISPRQGEPTDDEVHLRGEPALVNKIKAELEKTVATLRDRVVLAVEIPAAQHRILIGRGGQHLNELQTRTGVQVQFPLSRSYHQLGEAVNASEIKDADPADIVKVSGSRSACEAAIGELKVCHSR